jgi:hypothetical protein
MPFWTLKPKITSYALQKRNGSDWETIETFDAATYKRPPSMQDVSDSLEEGEFYRMAAFNGSDQAIYDTKTGCWQKRVRANKSKVPATDAGQIVRSAVQPAIEVFSVISDLTEAMGKMYQANAPQMAESSSPVEAGMTAFEQFKKQLTEYTEVQTMAARLVGYDPNRPQFPAMNFTGSAPWWIHPWALSYSKDFIKDVLGSLGETAQEFGYKFREGFNGRKPGQKSEATPEVKPPNIFEGQNESLQKYYEKLAKLQTKKKHPDDEEQPTAPLVPPTPPDSTPPVAPEIQK